ncbi:alginate lyase family protein [Massilia sp. 9I]|uniref:alginate lyase family protein n=1 Tax=Massilia sp. 9I TaxID=2653152 RepID=UPI0012F031F5|nr:alginate lyase family protein [Massilia sp. 9I]VXC51873.1 Exo-oligoalginate lyase [Massilia sp. 9I]
MNKKLLCRTGLLALLAFGSAMPAQSAPAQARAAAHPALVMTAQEVTRMRAEIARPGRFQRTFRELKAEVDRKIALPMQVPVPRDAGGGVTHEIHRNNSQLMYDAGVLYQLTGDRKYAHFVRDMLSMYAELYPTLPLHPQRKTDSVISAGRLFWQNLNESVWLVYVIQAYDAVLPALQDGERRKIENGILRPVALFLSEGSPHTFNTIHNHATWATTAVGMTGYVLGEREWVEKALYGSDKSGKGGFLRQLDELFSPDGYYNEGPYYQRYALLPFVTFAKAIETNEPQRKIFSYRDGIILKAVDTTIQLSYNKLFFPINDAIKDKGIDTVELVAGVAIAYSVTGDARLLDIARRQDRVLLTGDGMRVAQALDARRDQPFRFTSRIFHDGPQGKEGGLVVMREQDQALVLKATAQGMGHGHFDKLNWLFYDKGAEIVSDYGAARFLNIEAKFGGRYLPENKTYANQTIAHNTLVVDEGSHYGGKLELAEANHPELLYFSDKDGLKISAARVDQAYPGVSFVRTMAQLSDARLRLPIVLDVLTVQSDKKHQFDLPLHYKGHLIETNFALDSATQSMAPLGKRNGYQYLWLKARAAAAAPLSQITWLNDNGRFYTLSTLAEPGMQVLFTQIGANDPNFNLRNENAFVLRIPAAQNAAFVSVLEPHGGHDPVSEMTSNADSAVKQIRHSRTGDIDAVHLAFANGMEWLLLLNNSSSFDPKQTSLARFEGKDYPFQGRFKLIALAQAKATESKQ